MNKENNVKVKSIKKNVSIVPLNRDITNQVSVGTNPSNAFERAYSNRVEEAKCTWDIGIKIGFYVDNENNVIDALADLHMEKKGWSKAGSWKRQEGKEV